MIFLRSHYVWNGIELLKQVYSMVIFPFEFFMRRLECRNEFLVVKCILF